MWYELLQSKRRKWYMVRTWFCCCVLFPFFFVVIILILVQNNQDEQDFFTISIFLSSSHTHNPQRITGVLCVVSDVHLRIRIRSHPNNKSISYANETIIPIETHLPHSSLSSSITIDVHIFLPKVMVHIIVALKHLPSRTRWDVYKKYVILDQQGGAKQLSWTTPTSVKCLSRDFQTNFE